MVHLISSGSPFERDTAYSRAVVDGDWIFVSGTTGFDYATMTMSDDVVMRKYLGDARPAATMFSAGLADPKMKIEIEVTARRGN